ncbi:MAG: CRTAC1 family protein [Acidobacteriaceae bacterium]|nr:CRTAC1 family protein [Acidobacteriaceae bacterium]
MLKAIIAATILGAVALASLLRPPYTFTDVAATSGIHFTHYKGHKDIATILEEAGPGVCVADFDGDGWQDIYFVNGRERYGRGGSARNALYRNNGDGTFTDVTETAGVLGDAYGLGCVWGDYDNDGHPDLYVTQYGRNILYHNNGNGTFSDVTAKAHVDGLDFGARLHTGAVFFDYDRDGRLDLYAGAYVNFGPDSVQTCSVEGVQSSCPPQQYGGSPAILYHNNGDGTFTNVTKQAGVYNPNGKNLSVLAGDYDNDGWPDLFVANDGQELELFHNEHNGTFKEVGLNAGVATNEDGGTMAAMCLSLGDYNNDGFLDLYVSDFQDQGDHIWLNTGHGRFEEVTRRVGIAPISTQYLGFGGGFFDYDNDGWLDLFVANGHVYQGIETARKNGHYKQLNLLFHNDSQGKFVDVTAQAGTGFSIPHLGRGAAFGDFDNDGNVDIVVGNSGDPPLLLRNSGGSNHFLNLRLAGTKSNRDAMGARVKLRANGMTQIREVMGGGSYLSQSDLRVHFGLGSALIIESLDVAWPSGAHQHFAGVKADRFYLLQEGARLRDAGAAARNVTALF